MEASMGLKERETESRREKKRSDGAGVGGGRPKRLGTELRSVRQETSGGCASAVQQPERSPQDFANRSGVDCAHQRALRITSIVRLVFRSSLEKYIVLWNGILPFLLVAAT